MDVQELDRPLRIAVMVPTTREPVWITSLAELPDGFTSMVLADEDYRTLDMSADFDMLVSAHGPFARNIGGYVPKAYEVRLTAPLESGRSWEVPTLVALYLTMLGHEIVDDRETCDAVIMASGAVNMSLDIARHRYFLAKKLRVCGPSLANAAESGVATIVRLPSTSQDEETPLPGLDALPPDVSVGHDASLLTALTGICERLGIKATGIAAVDDATQDKAGAPVAREETRPVRFFGGPVFAGGALVAVLAGLGAAQSLEIMPDTPRPAIPPYRAETSQPGQTGKTGEPVVLASITPDAVAADGRSAVIRGVAPRPRVQKVGEISERPETGKSDADATDAPAPPARVAAATGRTIPVGPDGPVAGKVFAIAAPAATKTTGSGKAASGPQRVALPETGRDLALVSPGPRSIRPPHSALTDLTATRTGVPDAIALPKLDHRALPASTGPGEADGKKSDGDRTKTAKTGGENGKGTKTPKAGAEADPLVLVELRAPGSMSCKSLLFGGVKPVTTILRPDAEKRFLSRGGRICGLATRSDRPGLQFRVVYDRSLYDNLIGNPERYSGLVSGSNFIFFQRDIPVTFDYTLTVTELNSEGTATPSTYRLMTNR